MYKQVSVTDSDNVLSRVPETAEIQFSIDSGC